MSPTTGQHSFSLLGDIALLEQELESEADSSADYKGAGWSGTGGPMLVGVGCTAREFCDGQTLASPGRWEPEASKIRTHRNLSLGREEILRLL